jgi:hypothetical protein
MDSNKFALVSCAALFVVSVGCAGTTGGISLRPDGTPGPEACPEESKKAMNYLRMFVGEGGWVQIDANQSNARTITLYDGPIESVLDDKLGLLEAPARLYGRVWTEGPQVTIRYYEAQPMKGGNKIPICAVARRGFEQLRKRPESKPGTALIDSSSAGVFIVDEFR